MIRLVGKSVWLVAILGGVNGKDETLQIRCCDCGEELSA